MNQVTTSNVIDNSRKRILARGCDPHLSQWAVNAIPPMVGNPEYVATTDDEDFFDKLESQEWSVVYFAPGACRFSAARQPIPGGNSKTTGWTLAEYSELVREKQGEEIQIVETPYEEESIGLLTSALAKARDTR